MLTQAELVQDYQASGLSPFEWAASALGKIKCSNHLTPSVRLEQVCAEMMTTFQWDSVHTMGLCLLILEAVATQSTSAPVDQEMLSEVGGINLPSLRDLAALSVSLQSIDGGSRA
ncbi:MAG: hypothetical protein PWQ57_875 [Desulfovibrionales bacterium]|nr:hypothetical protein [Desulfovibrionales bacterium]